MALIRLSRAWTAILLGFFLLLDRCACALQKAAPVRVLVIKTSDNPLYARGSEGVLSGLKNRGYKQGERLDVSTITLTGNESDDMKALRDRFAKRPGLIVALGTDATRLTLSIGPTCPVVFSLILDPVRLGVAKSLDAPGGLFTGTTLLVSPAKQLEAFVQTAPAVKRIGLLYTDKDPTSMSFIEEAKEAAVRLKVEIVTQSQAEMGDSTKDALAALAPKSDAFWLIPDPASSGASAFTQTMELAKQKNIPVLGASSAMAQRGALMALSADISDLADLTADIAARILDGTATSATSRIRGPRKTILSLNLAVARSLSIKIPDSILHLADEVIETKPGGAR